MELLVQLVKEGNVPGSKAECQPFTVESSVPAPCETAAPLSSLCRSLGQEAEMAAVSCWAH